MTTPLEVCLRELCEIRSSGAGVNEISCYHPLATPLNVLGQGLIKPEVRYA